MYCVCLGGVYVCVVYLWCVYLLYGICSVCLNVFVVCICVCMFVWSAKFLWCVCGVKVYSVWCVCSVW